MRCDTWLRSMPLGRNWRQPIDVFIAAALPGAVRVGKVHINLQALGKLLMFGHFLALIVGQCLAHTARHMAQDPGKAFQSHLRISAVHLGQQDIAAGALDQRTDRAAVVRPLDQIPLPMPWHGTSLNLQWSLMDRAHAHDLASAIFALTSFTAGLVMLAQMGNQFLAQTASWLT